MGCRKPCARRGNLPCRGGLKAATLKEGIRVSPKLPTRHNRRAVQIGRPEAAMIPQQNRFRRFVPLLCIFCLLAGCGYSWRGEEASRATVSVLGDGSKTLKIRNIEQSTMYTWLPYMVRSLLRDDITARGLAQWRDSGEADFGLSLRVNSFQIRSYGQNKYKNILFTGTASMELILYDGQTNTEVWNSGALTYSDTFENANEEQAIQEILRMGVRRLVDRLQQRF